MDPSAPATDPTAPDTFTAAFSTSAGEFKIRAVRAWSPIGVDRLHRLLSEGLYNDTRIYRVVPGWVAQFGDAGTARSRAVTQIADDPPSTAGNLRGILSFSASYNEDESHATNRTNELYINLADHSAQLDKLGFTPIAAVVDGGMEAVVDAFFSGYGEMSDACALHHFTPCAGPTGARIQAEGNAYLDAEFPRLTKIYSASLVADEEDELASASVAEESAPPHRVELHVHLDGSVPPATLLRIARRRSLALPGLGGRVPETVDDIWASLRAMGEVWKWFDLVNEIIGGDVASLSEVAEGFAARRAAAGIRYTEVRYDPVRPATSRLANASISQEAVVRAVADGLQRGAARHGIEVHQLLCAMRGSPGQACFDVAALAFRMRSGALGGVVGMDIAGDEYHFNNSKGHVEACFRYAKRTLHLNTTVHAGEMAGPADVSSAVEIMLADRVGHGYSATEDEKVLQMLMVRGTPLEACPAGTHHGNLRATGVYARYGLNFGINTDDPAVYFQNASLGAVEELLVAKLDFSPSDIADAYARAYAARFAPDARRLVARYGNTALPDGRSSVDNRRSGGETATAALQPTAGLGFAALALFLAALLAAALGLRASRRGCGRRTTRPRRPRESLTQRKTKAIAALNFMNLDDEDASAGGPHWQRSEVI